MNELDPWLVCHEVLALVDEALKAAGRRSTDPDNPEPSYVAAGLVAADDCCGLLVAIPERVFRAAHFPVEGPDVNGCYDGQLAMHLMVLNMRCIPSLDDDGNPPTTTEMDDAYHELLLDAAIVWNTLANDLPYGSLFQNQVFIGAEGGCVGAETRITLDLDVEKWCIDGA